MNFMYYKYTISMIQTKMCYKIIHTAFIRGYKHACALTNVMKSERRHCYGATSPQHVARRKCSIVGRESGHMDQVWLWGSLWRADGLDDTIRSDHLKRHLGAGGVGFSEELEVQKVRFIKNTRCERPSVIVRSDVYARSQGCSRTSRRTTVPMWFCIQ